MKRRRNVHMFKKVRGRWKRFRGNPLRHNISAGFYDAAGTFHPIRSASDYSPSRVGEGGKRAKAKGGKKKKAKRRKR